MKANDEARVEYATERGGRKSGKRSVKMPGATRHEDTAASAMQVAAVIQQRKAERRAKRG